MIYGSVCSGIEAATMAWHPLGWTPAFFSEIEAFPSAVLAHHYGSNMPGEPLAKNGIPNYGDFTTIGPDAGPIDLLVGGTPCQSFSVAGKRLGLDDPRGNLALEYLALARRLRARWIVWENVPGVLSSHTDDEQGEEDEGDDGLESADFATFLSFVQECGYGFAYRVLDAQYVRVDDFARAVPQRRRRVFLVGYLGDWRRAAAVLLEPEGMRGDSAPRREAGQRAAPTIASRPTGGGGLGTDFDLDGGLIADPVAPAVTQAPYGDNPSREGMLVAFGGGNTSGSIDVSTALTAHGQRIDFEVETFVAEIAATLPAGGNSTGGERQPGMGAETAATMLVAHALRGEGFDASEDGTGRGTPIVPVCIHSDAIGRSGDAKTRSLDAAGSLRDRDPGIGIVDDGSSYNLMANGQPHAIVFDTTQVTSKTNRSQPKDGDPCHPLAAGAHAPAIAFGFEDRARGDDGRGYHRPPHFTEGLGPTIGTVKPPAVATSWAVRRLMPIECERLQGFPDNFTNVPWRGKETAPDGPRYKALGNSMACNAMRWIGQRIDIMEKLIRSGRIAA